MAYEIRLTDGTNLVTISPGEPPNSTYSGITLISQNTTGYGQFLNQNFIKLLENFSSGSAPTSPLTGQLWWNSSTKQLSIRSDDIWKVISSSQTGTAEPAQPIQGDFWWDTVNSQLKVYSGTGWVVVGPETSPLAPQTTLLGNIVVDNTTTNRLVGNLVVNNKLTAIFSSESFPFTPVNAPYSALQLRRINPGLNFGVATEATMVSSPNAAFGVSAGNVQVTGVTPGTGVNLNANVGGTQVSSLNVSGATGHVSVAYGPVSDQHVTTKLYVDTEVTNSRINVEQIIADLGDDLNTNLISNVNNVYDSMSVLNFFTNEAIVANATQINTQLSNLNSNVNTRFATVHGTIGTLAGNTASRFTSANVYVNTRFVQQADEFDTMIQEVESDVAQEFGRVDNTVDTLSGNVNSRMSAIHGTIGTLSGNVDSRFTNVNSTISALAGNVTTRFATLTDSVTTDIVRIDGTIGTLVSNVNSRFQVLDANVGVVYTSFATKAYVDGRIENIIQPEAGGEVVFTANIVPGGNLTYNLGSPTAWWDSIYGTAVHAKYADLAERFHADQPYDPGTVVELGGSAEITAVVADLSENVFGVISTNAAYLMNSGAGTDKTHPPVAVQGRVPVRVTGPVVKGDRLVSAGSGLARSADRSEITAWNVIGRALQDKTDHHEGIIEAVVKLNS